MTPQRFNILLVDDSPSDARLFELAMREVAPRVSLYWVATGGEALEALRRTERFRDITGLDVVILDLNMPGRDGFEILEQIKKDPVLAAIPVLVLSSSPDRRDVLRCYQLGANSYQVKPLTLEGVQELARAVARYWLELAELPDLSAL